MTVPHYEPENDWIDPWSEEGLRRQANGWRRIKRRRRIARSRAAWHLLRHGAVIYGIHFDGSIPGPIKECPRPVLISTCFADFNEERP